MTSWFGAQEDPDRASGLFLRFGELLRQRPPLGAHQHETVDGLVAVEGTGLTAEDPEPQIAAAALLELWAIQFRSLRSHLGGTVPAGPHGAVTADVLRAARLIDQGLGSFRRGRAEPGD